MNQTNWKEEFKNFVAPLDDNLENDFINVHPRIVEQFISKLLEQVINDIPDEGCSSYSCYNKEIKQQLKEKYLNN